MKVSFNGQFYLQDPGIYEIYLEQLGWSKRQNSWSTVNPWSVLPLRSFASPSVTAELKQILQERNFITYREGLFVADSPTYLGWYLKHLGWKQNLRACNWYTDDKTKLQYLDKYLNEEARCAVRELKAPDKKLGELSFIAKDGKELFPFQKEGLKFLLDRPKSLLGDEMGLGKTPMAINLLNAEKEISKVLIICPASLKFNWRNELQNWLLDDKSIVLPKKSWEQGDIAIVNFELIAKFSTEIRATKWDLMIVDEAHYLKNSAAKRTKAILGTAAGSGIKAKRTVFLTGTPILNRPVEFWTLAHALCPAIFASKTKYLFRYCDPQKTPFGWDFSGAANLDELNRIAKDKFMLRRRKSDVLLDLPPKLRQVLRIEADKPSLIKENQKHWSSYQELTDKLNQAKLKPDFILEDKDGWERLKNRANLEFSEMAEVRHQTAVAKLPFVIEHLKNVLESEAKVVVFAHHKDVIDGIFNAFHNEAVVVSGDVKTEKRQLAVDRFQNDPEIRVFIGSITAAGVGLTLTASSQVVFAELDWVPSNLTQAEDRLHRIGQASSVLVQHIVLDGSIDANMIDLLIKKQEVIDQVVNNDTKSSHPDSLIARGYLEIPRIRVEQIASLQRRINAFIPHSGYIDTEDLILWQQLRKHKIWSLPQASWALLLLQKYDKPQIKESPKVRSEVVVSQSVSALSEVQVRSHLRYLVDLDKDQARRRNNQGFAKFDGDIARSLLNFNFWSEKQLSLAKKIVHKYRKQLGLPL